MSTLPVESSSLVVDFDRSRLPKYRRNQHVLSCVRRDMARRLKRPQKTIHYCYECFNWVVADVWDDHCRAHLSALTSKRCGTITHCHTLVRPAYCPDCLGRENLPVDQRMISWTRDHKLWEHMNAHMNEYSWPRACPHLICKREASLQKIVAPQFENEEKFQFHLIDEHGFSYTRPRCLDGPASTTHESFSLGRKRTLDGDETSEWVPSQCFESMSMSRDCLSPSRPRKRARKMTPTICPPLLSTSATEGDEHLMQMDTYETVPSRAHVPNNVGLGDAELTQDLERPGRHWVSTCDSFNLDSDTTDPDPGSSTLFSLYLRSPSPSSSTELPSECSGETLVPVDSELSSPDSPEKPIAEHGSDHKLDRIEEKPPSSPRKPRIRLRITPPKPKLLLRLTRPRSKGSAKRWRKRI